MKNVIIYTRVSTDEQADNGYSLPAQERILKEFCNIKGCNIVSHFKEDFSAKTFNRPEWKKLKEFVKLNKKNVDSVLCHKWDRFSRNMENALAEMRELRKYGIEVNTVEQPLDLSHPDSKLLLAIYLTVPEIENDKNSIRTTEGSRQARLEGCWTGTAPFGYKNVRDHDGRSTLQANDKAIIVKNIFTEFAKGIYNAEEVRKLYKAEGLKLSKMAFLNMLRNVAYIGKVHVKAWGKNESLDVQGLHEPIIEEELFLRVQSILRGRKKNWANRILKTRDNLELRGFLKCKFCGNPLTGSKSKGRTHHYYYYHCNNNKCQERFRADYANRAFEDYLSTFQFSKEVIDLYEMILEDTYKQTRNKRASDYKELERQIEVFSKKLENIQDLIVDEKISTEDYQSMKNRYLNNQKELISRLTEIKVDEKSSLNHLRFGMSLLRNLTEYYSKADLPTKRSIIGSIFPEKLEFEKGQYRTPRINEVVNLILLKSKELQTHKNKQADNYADLSTWAPPVGLEPTTL
jgi:site-specific DNA recombinase